MNWLKRIVFLVRSGSSKVTVPTDDPDLAGLVSSLGALPKSQYDDFIFRNPALLSRRRFDKVLALEGERHLRNKDFAAAVAYLEMLRHVLVEDIGAYPLGRGPIEILSDQLANGEISLEMALRQAAGPNVVFHLSLLYVTALSDANERMAGSDDWRYAVNCHQLLVVAVDCLEPYAEDDEFRMMSEAVLTWLHIVRATIAKVPNGELYVDAMTRGRLCAEAAKQRGVLDELASALHRMGTLNLDPYTVGHSSGDPDSYHRWLSAARDTFGNAAAAAKLAKLPSPMEAIKIAVDLLTQASELRSGRRLGLTLKALAQAQAKLHDLGGSIDAHTVAETAHRSTSLLDSEIDQEPLQVARLIMRAFGPKSADQGNVPTGEPKQVDDDNEFEQALLIAKSVLANEMEATGDEKNTALRLVNAAKVEMRGRLFDKLVLFKAADLLMRAHSGGDRLVMFVHQECVVMLCQVFVRARDAELPDDIDGLTRFLDEQAIVGGYPGRGAIFARVALAASLTAKNREDLALEIIRGAHDDPGEWDRWSPAFASFPAVLHTGAGENSFEAGRLEEAIQCYLEGFAEYLRVNVPTPAVDLLLRAVDIAQQLKTIDLVPLLPSLIPAIMNAERIGDVAVTYTHLLCRELLAATYRAGTGEPRALAMMFHLAKGFRFGELVGVGAIEGLQETDADRKLIDSIIGLEAVVPRLQSVPAKRVSEGSLCSYLGVTEAAPGGDGGERLRNLRHSFDRRQVEKMIRAVRPTLARTMKTLDRFDDLLGPDDVLLSYYFGAGRNGKQALFCLLSTSTDVSLVVNENLADWTDEVDISGRLVMATRTTVLQEAPPGSHISAAGARALEVLGTFMLPPDIKRLLAEKRDEGKRHLCIIPHHATHFCPIHLADLGGGRLLADEWIVTYMPSLTVLGQDSLREGAERSKIAVFGMAFLEGQDGWGCLPEAATEARAISQFFGTEPILDREASVERVLEAFRTSRRVHIASHGRHNAEAPAFQCVILHGADSMRPLSAYELQGMDFAGLDLVSLSACETSLGRVDLMDNLRGLSATLFMAGARTVVGTLWPIDTDAAEFFFTEFYRAISSGDGKLAAFDAAQGLTRARFPTYSDWGAMYLSGKW
ncbi:CHAT domain-containing protein [Acidisoma sp. S159]|uniref:CHAT domain-containing protein n=1 Tax=Acidisoma sp. S159 TaxID=1747225 RepID=UPI00131B300A|nr:CHAT domain-containing protein [Acidisoma sp. S159]